MTKPSSQQQDEMVAYYGLCFSAAAADGRVHRKELEAIFDQVPMDDFDQVHQSKIEGLLFERDTDAYIKVLQKASFDDRCRALVGVAEIIFADERIEPAEETFLNDVATRLKVESDQRDAIFQFVQTGRRVTAAELPNAEARREVEVAMRSLMSHNVSLDALRISNTTKAMIARGWWD